jgi:hypothetical protein
LHALQSEVLEVAVIIFNRDSCGYLNSQYLWGYCAFVNVVIVLIRLMGN